MLKRAFPLLAVVAMAVACTPSATSTDTSGATQTSAAPLDSGEPQPTPTTYTLVAQSTTDGGQVSPSSVTVSHGESATFEITVAPGFLLHDVTGCPGVLEGDDFTIDAVTSACELEVSFEPGVVSYRTVMVDRIDWEYRTSETMPDFEYAGEWYEGGLVGFYPQVPAVVADLWVDGLPDVLVSFSKAQASGIDTRFPPVLFRNDGSRFREATDELIGGMPAIAFLRRSVVVSDGGGGFTGVLGVSHDAGDGRSADALLLASGVVPENVTDSLPRLPLADAWGRATAVDAHSLTGGDLNGDGMVDFIVGEFVDPRGPYRLIQIEPGEWQLVEDPFLASLAYAHPRENPGNPDDTNLLLDLHLVDVNGDSFDDLVVGWGHGSTYSYLYVNDGQGGFSNDDRRQLPESVYGVDNALHLMTHSLDADGDGSLDLLIVYSRDEPYYGGYVFQLLLNDGSGNFRDHTAVGIQNLRDQTIRPRLDWTDNFYLLDVNHDGLVDIVGSDYQGVRLWLHEPGAVFREVVVRTAPEHQGVAHVFVDMGDGSVHALVFREQISDDGTERQIWFEQSELLMETLPLPDPPTFPTDSSAPPFDQTDPGYEVFGDELAPEWFLLTDNGTTVTGGMHVLEGSSAIEVTLEVDGGLSFTFDGGSFDASEYDYIAFYLHGGETADQQLVVAMKSQDGAELGEWVFLSDDYIDGGALQPGAWHWVAVPLTVLNPQNGPIAWIDVVDVSGLGASSLYIDEVRFVAAAP